MTLSAEIIKLLNDFADSQPALRLPGKPWAESNPQLGTVLDDALSAADAENATGVAYTPTVGGNWSPAPTTAQGALDQLAARTTAAEADVLAAQADATQALTDAATAQSTAEAAAAQAYTPTTGANWVDTDPATIQQALDRLAAVVATLNAGPIP